MKVEGKGNSNEENGGCTEKVFRQSEKKCKKKGERRPSQRGLGSLKKERG
jgi:hypothetical protein